jgi:hypothetical protein
VGGDVVGHGFSVLLAAAAGYISVPAQLKTNSGAAVAADKSCDARRQHSPAARAVPRFLVAQISTSD